MRKLASYQRLESNEILIPGEMAVMYLYMRYRYHWNEVKFSMFTTFAMVTNLIGE